MTNLNQAREGLLILSGILIGIALGQYIATQQAERSRLSSRLFALESEARSRRPDHVPPVPVRVVVVDDQAVNS